MKFLIFFIGIFSIFLVGTETYLSDQTFIKTFKKIQIEEPGNNSEFSDSYQNDLENEKLKEEIVTDNPPLEPIRTYTNSFGQEVQVPTLYAKPPANATARCRDGEYSFSKNRRGTCSGHGGVAEWLK